MNLGKNVYDRCEFKKLASLKLEPHIETAFAGHSRDSMSALLPCAVAASVALFGAEPSMSLAIPASTRHDGPCQTNRKQPSASTSCS